MTDSKQSLKETSSIRINVVTLVSIAIVTQLICSLIHEVMGHSLAIVLVGGDLTHFSSVDADYSTNGLTVGAERVIHMAGIIMNLFIGWIVLMIGRRLSRLSANTRYFLWLLGHVNLFIGGGYMMALSFAGFGDVDSFVEGLANPAIWKTAFTLLGVLISFTTLKHGIKTLEPFLGNDYAVRRKRGRAFTLIPYLTAGIVSIIAALFNPIGMILVATSAAASSFGGEAFLAWMCLFVREKKTETPTDTLTITRSALWIGMAVLALILDIVVLGPGIPR